MLVYLSKYLVNDKFLLCIHLCRILFPKQSIIVFKSNEGYSSNIACKIPGSVI